MRSLLPTPRFRARSLAMLAIIWLTAPALAARQEAAPAAEIGAPPFAEQAWRFVGQARPGPGEDGQLILTGRLTAVSGFDPASLAAPGADAESGSRFTFVAELLESDVTSLGDTVTATGDGVLTIYLHDGSALDPGDPASFQAGLAVAEFAAAFRSSDLPIDTDQGVVTGTMNLTQTESFTFTLDDVRYRFGHAGLELSVRYTGGFIAGADGGTPPGAAFYGNAAVSARAANPTDTGEARAGLSECEALLAWIDGTRSRLELANTFRADVLSGAVIPIGDLAAAATGVADLATVQREQAAPEAGSEAERLALAALGTDARGFELLVAAVEADNEEAVTQALAILADGAALTERALSTLDEITPVCESTS